MKMLNMVIHANMQHPMADLLQSIDVVKGFTFTPVQGHGSRVEQDPFLSNRDRVVGYTPRIKVEVMLQDADVEPVLSQLRNAMQHDRNQGRYWITPIEEMGRL